MENFVALRVFCVIVEWLDICCTQINNIFVMIENCCTLYKNWNYKKFEWNYKKLEFKTVYFKE